MAVMARPNLELENRISGPRVGSVHPAWQRLMQYCAELGHGEIEKLKIQDGVPDANRTDGHTHLLICDSRTMDKIIGMNVTAASTSRIQLSWFNTGVNRIATN